MISKSFFEDIEHHFQNKLPFVVFRYPNQTKLTAFLDFGTFEKSNKKFIVSPFDSSIYFWIYSHKILDFDYSSEITPSTSEEIKWLDFENKHKEHTELIAKPFPVFKNHLSKKLYWRLPFNTMAQ